MCVSDIVHVLGSISPVRQVQDIVVGNKTFTDVAKPSEIVQLLLNEDQLANLDTNAGDASAKGAITDAT